MPENLQPALFILGGILLCLYASWQLIKRGFILWVGILILGTIVVQMGLKNPDLNIQNLWKDIDTTNLTQASLKNAQRLCEGIEKLD